ncbi:MAG: haloacid dehalogenase-like hydrolase [Actinomycetota bacterium]|nr:haloacid dehalogenase-like hydrolase [Actinomycetota bacterium]
MLLLFDIDGTLLLKAHVDHREALHAALREVHGIADPAAAHFQAAGRTDGEIARAIALQSGVSAERIDDCAAAVREATCREYARRCPPDLRSHLAPGMAELLGGLPADVRLSLVTGNFEPVARLKLERSGLADNFPAGQGGFGSDDEDRSALPGIARRRAGLDGTAYPRERTVVIGDTPNDVACAHADGVRCLAVATGPFTADELRAAGADAVATDGRGLGTLIERL